MCEVKPEGVRGKRVSREGEDLAEETASSEALSWGGSLPCSRDDGETCEAGVE